MRRRNPMPHPMRNPNKETFRPSDDRELLRLPSHAYNPDFDLGLESNRTDCLEAVTRPTL